jgi:Fe-S-cluster containining protein
MEIGEAASLAGAFVTRALFRLHSLPLQDQGRRATQWYAGQTSTLPLRATLEETRNHLAHFAVRTEIDRASGRVLYLTISALTLDPAPGRCPALSGALCGIHPDRPLTCRTVPLHYSRPVSSLTGYLDGFVQTPTYICDPSSDAPRVLADGKIVDMQMLAARRAAFAQAEADRAWKAEIVRLIENPDDAAAASLPSYGEVRRHSEAGSVSLVPMLAAWRVARRMGLLSAPAFADLCRQQAKLIQSESSRCTDPAAFADLQAILPGYEREASPAAAAFRV